MATKTVKSRPGGSKANAAKRPQKAKAGPKAPAKPEPFESYDDGKPYSFLKHAVLPSAACGILLAVVAMEEGADLPVAALVGVCLAAVITGMIKLKNSLYGR
jgi:hypothetical protein